MTGPAGPASGAGDPPDPSVTGAPEPLLVPAARPLPVMVDRIVERHRQELPDLSRLVVVLPSLLAASDFVRLLAARVGRAVLLPRLTTFAGLAAAVPGTGDVLPDVRRDLLLYGVLRDQGLVPAASLWSSARELRRLLDELSAHHVPLAGSLEEFSTLLETAYGVRASASVRFEARVVFEAWRHLAGERDSAFRYQAALAESARRADGPLWVLDAEAIRPVEAAFLADWARCQPVSVLAVDPGSPGTDGVVELLAAAWDAGGDRDAIRARANRLRERVPVSPVTGRLSLHGARTLEGHAAAADLRIRGWLAEGVQRIAVVAMDRVTARRLRALLERGGILVQDETGWALSTVAAATVVVRWLDCVSAGFRYQDLLDLLKSPFIFSDRAPDYRAHVAWRVEAWLRQANLPAGLDALRALVTRDPAAADLLPAMDILDAARRTLTGRARGASLWLDALLQALSLLGISGGLEQDAAGREVLDTLRALRSEAAGEGVRLSFAEFRQWLDGELEAALFRDRDIRSPVVFTHLSATRLRQFDAAIVLGAQGGSLPPAPVPGLFFNDAVRRDLGLPSHEREVALARSALGSLLLSTPRVFVTWQDTQDGEPVALSPWLDLVEVVHQEAYGTGLRTSNWDALVAQADRPPVDDAPLPPLPVMPKPRVPAIVPDRVSVSAYGALLGCPYRYFAGEVLGLGELDDITEEMEKRDYGERLHRVLLAFHRRVPRVSDLDADSAEAILAQLTEAEFGDASRQDPLARAWAMRWRKHIAGYVAFQRDREAAGWVWADGERRREIAVALPSGDAITLHGRLDRIDECASADVPSLAVLDYKTTERSRLAQRLRSGEDAQLRCYAMLLDDVSQAAYVSIDGGAVSAVELPDEPAAAAASERDRLRAIFGAMRAGAPLPANGADAVCARCEMRGVCRRDHWGAA